MRFFSLFFAELRKRFVREKLSPEYMESFHKEFMADWLNIGGTIFSIVIAYAIAWKLSLLLTTDYILSLVQGAGVSDDAADSASVIGGIVMFLFLGDVIYGLLTNVLCRRVEFCDHCLSETTIK